jgi:hypothetical protein
MGDQVIWALLAIGASFLPGDHTNRLPDDLGLRLPRFPSKLFH